MTIIHAWFKKADEDLYSAQQLLKSEGYLSISVICFHCQQAAEKYLKGFLVYRNIEFKKTHDLLYLLSLLGEQQLNNQL